MGGPLRIESAAGKTVLGLATIRCQHPHQTPTQSKNEPAPLVHAFGSQARRALRDAYGAFLAAYREAARRLKDGDPEPGFPPGCFPPALPFVPAAAPRPP